MLSALRRLGALVATLTILALGAQACMSALEPARPPVARPASLASPPGPTAAAPQATATPLAPTPAPQERPAGPAYGLLDRQLAAGWTPAARDLTVGDLLYRRLDERVGASCRIEVVTGQDASGQVQLAQVWVDCEALP